MFDCPLQIHTSPISTLVQTILFLPEIARVNGPPAFIGCNRASQLPSDAAWVTTLWPSISKLRLGR
jgi:hypothetical protein